MRTAFTPGALPPAKVPAVIFPNWRELLNRERLSATARGGYALAIGGYLDYCRHNGLSVTLQSARGYMADVERRRLARNPELWKRGLNWFFAQGRRTVTELGAVPCGKDAVVLEHRRECRKLLQRNIGPDAFIGIE